MRERNSDVAYLASRSEEGRPLVSSAELHLSCNTSTHTHKHRNITVGCYFLFKSERGLYCGRKVEISQVE